MEMAQLEQRFARAKEASYQLYFQFICKCAIALAIILPIAMVAGFDENFKLAQQFFESKYEQKLPYLRYSLWFYVGIDITLRVALAATALGLLKNSRWIVRKSLFLLGAIFLGRALLLFTGDQGHTQGDFCVSEGFGLLGGILFETEVPRFTALFRSIGVDFVLAGGMAVEIRRRWNHFKSVQCLASKTPEEYQQIKQRTLSGLPGWLERTVLAGWIALLVLAGGTTAFVSLQARKAAESSRAHPFIAVGTRAPRIHQPPVRDRIQTPFGWAHTTTALLEQDYLVSRKARVDLSEDYLAALNYAEQLQRGLPIRGYQEIFGAFELIEKYGIVPQSAFPAGMRHNPSQAISALAPVFPMRAEEARTLVSQVFGKRIPKPDEPFTFQGRTFTPLSFARDVLGFRRDAWVVRVFPHPENAGAEFKESLETIRATILSGRAAALSYPMLQGLVVKDHGHSCHPCTADARTNGAATGLIVDFLSNPDNEDKAPLNALVLRDSAGRGLSMVSGEGFPSLDGLPSFKGLLMPYVEAIGRVSIPPPLDAAFDFSLGYRNAVAFSSGKRDSGFAYLVVPRVLPDKRIAPPKARIITFEDLKTKAKAIRIPLRFRHRNQANSQSYPEAEEKVILFRSAPGDICIGVEPPPGARWVTGYVHSMFSTLFFVFEAANDFEQCRYMPVGVWPQQKTLVLQASGADGTVLGQDAYLFLSP